MQQSLRGRRRMRCSAAGAASETLSTASAALSAAPHASLLLYRAPRKRPCHPARPRDLCYHRTADRLCDLPQPRCSAALVRHRHLIRPVSRIVQCRGVWAREGDPLHDAYQAPDLRSLGGPLDTENLQLASSSRLVSELEAQCCVGPWSTQALLIGPSPLSGRDTRDGVTLSSLHRRLELGNGVINGQGTGHPSTAVP
jgi:hypothetical protein